MGPAGKRRGPADKDTEIAEDTGFLKRSESIKKEKEKNTRDFGVEIVQFVAFYGHAVYDNPDHYSTEDGIIPHKLFELMFREMTTGIAFQRINQAYAYRIGRGWYEIPDKWQFRKELRAEQTQAGFN